ncbi:MAG: class I SAM-dependent methyltransferase [Patescibacteria group bacterium]
MAEKRHEYEREFARHGFSFRSLKWNSKSGMRLRHEELITDLTLEDKSILDVGCGFGDIIEVLKERSKDFSYTGIDMVSAFVEEARKRYPNFRFIVGDYFNEPLEESFDIILSSGVLNSNFPEPMRYRKLMIKTMFGHCRYAVAFDMAGGYPPPQNRARSKIYYADSLEILKYCLSLTKRVILRQHYYPKDFTLILFK